jgi:hypothetical protein
MYYTSLLIAVIMKSESCLADYRMAFFTPNGHSGV